jgi:hypothetical protein
MLELGVEEQADRLLTTQTAVAKRIRLNDLINDEIVFMRRLGWVNSKFF